MRIGPMPVASNSCANLRSSSRTLAGTEEQPTLKKQLRTGSARSTPLRSQFNWHGFLLTGMRAAFRPRVARQRYCGDECLAAARRWSRWRAQQSYRAPAAGKDERNGQSRSLSPASQKSPADSAGRSGSGSREFIRRPGGWRCLAFEPLPRLSLVTVAPRIGAIMARGKTLAMRLRDGCRRGIYRPLSHLLRGQRPLTSVEQ
jgi:hypothetical protein